MFPSVYSINFNKNVRYNEHYKFRFNNSFKRIDNYVKIYPDRIRSYIYKSSFISDTRPDYSFETDELNQSSLDDPLQKSLNRTKTVISDYIYCNNFTIFGTLTFDPALQPKAVDLTDYEQSIKVLNMAVKLKQEEHLRKFGTRFDYLTIPEQHKSGVFHFHILLTDNFKFSLNEFYSDENPFLGKKERSFLKTNYKSKLNKKFFWKGFKLGRNQFEFIRDKERVSSYVKKYITKDLAKIQSGKRRYFASKTLKKPVVLHNFFDNIKYDDYKDNPTFKDFDFFTTFDIFLDENLKTFLKVVYNLDL